MLLDDASGSLGLEASLPSKPYLDYVKASRKRGHKSLQELRNRDGVAIGLANITKIISF